MEGTTFFIKTKDVRACLCARKYLRKGIAPYHVEMPVKHLRREEMGSNLCTAHIIRIVFLYSLCPVQKMLRALTISSSPFFICKADLYCYKID